MFTIEHRRHTMRSKPGAHLSQAGVELARSVGEQMGSFDRVVTSTAARAFETAIAMGYAVDERVHDLDPVWPDDVAAEVSPEAHWPEFADAAGRHPDGAYVALGRRLAELQLAIGKSLPENGRALIVSHGALVECATIGCLPDLDYETWGRAVAYTEGVRLRWDAGRWLDAELLRVPGAPLLV
jgi:broad specificity phosphatase PhoE